LVLEVGEEESKLGDLRDWIWSEDDEGDGRF
jgi:hypothetical protein